MPDTYTRNINEGAFAGHSVCLIETAAPAHLDPIPEYSSDDEIAAVDLIRQYSKMSDKDWTGKERITLLHAWVSENLYDVALQLLEVEHHKKELALTTDKNALLVLAKNPPFSDFHGDPSCVEKAVKSEFKVLAHTIETVEEQQTMLGCGETPEQVVRTMEKVGEADVDVITFENLKL
ncbi:hypothetical protein DCAR_0830424 [Daucus carota subsp. sativus]|uniref:Uncharacterized protein n=1 Tax=Daucus carota subsp. sativus TaxID=79200 RepID=A0A175YKE2_DAUCS|nr:hypothetical protein DCAR_0830424 [Daucus carota subsp. sativus]